MMFCFLFYKDIMGFVISDPCKYTSFNKPDCIRDEKHLLLQIILKSFFSPVNSVSLLNKLL